MFDQFSRNLLKSRYFHWSLTISVFEFRTAGTNLQAERKSEIVNMSREFRSDKAKELTELRYDERSYYQYLLKPVKI